MVYLNNLNEEYPMLEYRLNKSREIPYIKGIKIRVDELYCIDYKSWKRTLEEIAKNKHLKLESVKQAINWCEKNNDLITRILEKEWNEAGLK